MGSSANNLAGLVLALADESQPDWVALEHHGQRVGIRRLARLMCSAAGALSGDGVVAICEPDPIGHTVAVLGALAAGRPALLLDARQPDGLLTEVLARAQARSCVGRELADVQYLSFDQLLAPSPVSPVPLDPMATGSIFMTSGSTGAAKLVVRSAGADLNAAMCLALARFPIGPGDRHWLAVPHSSAAFLTLVMGSLLLRATVVFAPFAREEVDRTLVEHAISSVYLVPTMLRLARERDGLRGRGWDRLRALATGGERLDDQTAATLLELFPERVFCAYGMTECPRVCEASFEEIAARPGTVGRPIALRQVKIAAPDGGGEIDQGADGEVLVRGPDMFSGYLGEPPVGDWYATGDLGHIDGDGYLYITGRASSLVNVGANRVSTEEVAAVLREHPDIAQGAVIALEDSLWTNRLEAFAVTRAGCELSESDLRAWLAERLAHYKLPRNITFLEQMPIDHSGKLSLRTLQEVASR
jgi:fatty-acyl-CoA synthase